MRPRSLPAKAIPVRAILVKAIPAKAILVKAILVNSPARSVNGLGELGFLFHATGIAARAGLPTE
jgi:hypothetical protein